MPLRTIRAAPGAPGRVLQQHFPRALVLAPPAPAAEHLAGQQPTADAPRSDLLQGQIPHLQVAAHGGLLEEPGGAGEAAEAHWLQQLVGGRDGGREGGREGGV